MLLPGQHDIRASERLSLYRVFPLPLQLLWVKPALRNVGLFSTGHFLFGYLVLCWLLENMLFSGFFVCFLVTSKLSNVHCKQPNSAGAANTTLPGLSHTPPPFLLPNTAVFPIGKFQTGFLNSP